MEYKLRKTTVGHILEIITMSDSPINLSKNNDVLFKDLGRLRDVNTRQQTLNGIYYLVEDTEGIIQGYIKITEGIPQETLQELQWTDEYYKMVLENIKPQHIVLSGVNVQDTKQRGVRTLLYETMFKRYPEDIFTTLIEIVPNRKTISEQFHSKQGFNSVATYKDEEGNVKKLYARLPVFNNK